jgi:hypothetical protein
MVPPPSTMRDRVDDRDLADAVLGGVDPVDDQLVVAVVGDVDVGVAVGRLDHPAAGAQDLAGQDDPAALGHHVVHDDGLLAASKYALTGTRSVPKLTPVSGLPLSSISSSVRPEREVAADVQFDVLRAALDQAVDVQVTGRDGDGALRQDARAGSG